MSIHVPIKVNTHEAKSNLSALIREVEEGGEVIIARNGKPVAKLTSYTREPNPVVFGEFKDEIVYKDEDFVGTDPEILEMFESSGQSLCD